MLLSMNLSAKGCNVVKKPKDIVVSLDFLRVHQSRSIEISLQISEMLLLNS